jgi:ketosteroid isomerase-like protein
MTFRSGLLAGVALALAARRLLDRVLLFKLRRDISRLNVGDYEPLLAGFADDAVIRFNEGPHRFSGTHRGRAAIELLLRNFTNAGIQGEIRAIWRSGPPWAMTLMVRFDDGATGADGEQLYANRTVLLARTRWGRIVEQEDFYEDTARIDAFDRRLTELGIPPLAAGDAAAGDETGSPLQAEGTPND